MLGILVHEVGFLDFDKLLRSKAVPNLIFTPIIFKNPIKTGVSIRNTLVSICLVGF